MAKPTGQEMVAIFKEEKNPTILAFKMDDFINNLTVDTKGFVEELKGENESLKILFSAISLLWVKKLKHSFKEDSFDYRNKYSVETSNEISKLLGAELEAYHPEYAGYLNTSYEEAGGRPFEVDFVEAMARTHRTLQQTFSGIVFLWLTEMQEVVEDAFLISVSQKITADLEEGFYRTPMI